jgi:hypothetical protein
MTKLKAICATTILGLAFTIPASAGDIHSPGAANPGDMGTPGVTSTEPGDIHSPGLANTLGDVMLDILLGAISLF